MSKKPTDPDEMRDEYDFSNAVQGKYAELFKKGSNVVVIEPDLAREFPTAKSVNKALREYLAKKKGAA